MAPFDFVSSAAHPLSLTRRSPRPRGQGPWVNHCPQSSNSLTCLMYCARTALLRGRRAGAALSWRSLRYLTLPSQTETRSDLSRSDLSRSPIMGDHDLPSHAPTRRPLSQASRPSLATAAPSQTSSSLKSTRSAPALPVRLAGSTRAARTAGGLACGEKAACKVSSGRSRLSRSRLLPLRHAFTRCTDVQGGCRRRGVQCCGRVP